MTSPEYKTNLVNGQEKIRVEHLNRQAYIYIRQSSAGQVVYHRESQINQEQMADRAYLLGWDPSDVQIIRTDLGISGRDADNRKGFQKLLSEVSLGQVGIIFGYEVSRLARNNSDWYKLLEAAAIFDTLIADYDGVYDLNLFNDRLLLGLKGTMSEAELHLIQLRLVAGRKRQLERGVYRQYLPTGYIRLNDGTVIQDPNEQIRRCFQLIFSKFRQLGSCNKLLAYLREESILIPRRQVSGIHKGETLWKVPAYAALYQILTIPTYAGAMVYGRRQTQRSSTTRLRKPMDQWKYIHQGTYPAYISWDEYIDNQQRLQLNGTIARPVNESTQGASREGAALLQGFVFCGECGQRISIAYKPYGRYVCQMLRRRFGEPSCMMLKADPIDQVVVQAFFEALQPAQLDALTSVLHGYDQEYSQLKQHWHDRIQQARYEAQRAQRFYQAVDPENRLVAAELERHWETTLHTLQETELAYEEFERQHQPPSLSPELSEQFRHICQQLPLIWADLSNIQKKELLRSLIAKVILLRPKPDQVEVKIIWVSGHFSLHRSQTLIHRNQDLSDYERMLTRIHDLWQQNLKDDVIAKILTTEGFTSARLHHISRHTVQVIRMEQRWLCSSSPAIATPKGYLKVAELAEQLHIQPGWLYRCIREEHLDAADTVRYPKRNVILIRDDPQVIEKIQRLKET